MKISNPLRAVWCIIVKSRRGWCESCRLPLSRVLLLSLYWGGEVILIWGWYNSPEVTGDLMRGTWHWNVLCANAALPMQMTVEWRRVQGWERAAVPPRWSRSRRATKAAMHLEAFILISARIYPLFLWKNFPEAAGALVWLVRGSFLIDVIQKEGSWTLLTEASYDLSLLNNTPSKRNLWSVNPEVKTDCGQLVGWCEDGVCACLCLCVCVWTDCKSRHHCRWWDW